MKNIIVTGGSGTIGTAIVENIIKNGDKAWVIDILVAIILKVLQIVKKFLRQFLSGFLTLKVSH